MNNRTKQGMNRTGIKTSPIQAPKMLEVTKITVPTTKTTSWSSPMRPGARLPPR